MYIRVKVFPSQKKEIFKEVGKERFEVSVKEKALNNEANKRVLQIFSDFYKVSPGKVRIVNGHRSPTKLLIVEI